MTSESDSIDAAFEQLKHAIRAGLRAEQLLDRLTRLPNDEALTEWLEEKVESSEGFWIAFVEVDRFKSVNDEFGYDSANERLRQLAQCLVTANVSYFDSSSSVFRAHGDEFFIAGPMPQASQKDCEEVSAKLDRVRQDIGGIHIVMERASRPMMCTVSVGWLVSTDSGATDEGCTQPAVRRQLELAVGEAKLERNKVVRFTPEMRRPTTRDARGDCRSCHAKFSVVVPAGNEGDGALFCPNCGERLERPGSLKPQAKLP